MRRSKELTSARRNGGCGHTIVLSSTVSRCRSVVGTRERSIRTTLSLVNLSFSVESCLYRDPLGHVLLAIMFRTLCYRYLRVFQVWQWTVPQYKEVWTLVSLARLYRDCASRQCLKVRGISLCSEGFLCQMRQWTWSRVSKWRPQAGAVTLLNILLFPYLQGKGRGTVSGRDHREGMEVSAMIWQSFYCVYLSNLYPLSSVPSPWYDVWWWNSLWSAIWQMCLVEDFHYFVLWVVIVCMRVYSFFLHNFFMINLYTSSYRQDWQTHDKSTRN